MNTKNVLRTLIMIAVSVLAFWALMRYAEKRIEIDPGVATFAQCLASEGLTMYGAAWCSHCKAEKARFGAAFSYVPYVECPENQQLCLDKGINGYPTWIDKDGVKYEGEQGLDGLAEISGCTLP